MTALALALTPAALLLAPSAAEACSCMRSTSAVDSARGADVVFKATVVSVEDAPGQASGGLPASHDMPQKIFTFAVSETYKGNLDPEIRLYTATNSAACGRDYGAAGSEWLIYANRSDSGELRDNLCSRSISITETQAAEDILAFEGQDLDAPPEPAGPRPVDGDAPIDMDPPPLFEGEQEPQKVEPEPTEPSKKGCSVGAGGSGLEGAGLLGLALLLPLWRRRRRQA